MNEYTFDEEVIEDIDEAINDENVDETFLEEHDKNAYMKIQAECPRCFRQTLEYQNVGFEREIFCTNCEYHSTMSL